jgi:hypothetical protein
MPHIKTRIEPAAILIAAFEINVRRKLQIVARFQNGDARRAGIEPNV